MAIIIIDPRLNAHMYLRWLDRTHRLGLPPDADRTSRIISSMDSDSVMGRNLSCYRQRNNACSPRRRLLNRGT